MKTKRHCIALLFVIVLIIPFSSYATDDTDVYDITTNIKPNVLIIFDNSTSMTDGVPYDDAQTYTGTYTTDTIYERTCVWWNRWHTYCYQYNWYVSSMTLATFEAGDADDDGIYDSDSGIRKGNRLNYEQSPGNKLTTAKTATKQIIEDTYQFVRLGVMVMRGGLADSSPDFFKDPTVLSTTYGGSPIKQWDDSGVPETDKDTLKGYIDLIDAGGGASGIHYTPLANRLIAAAQYFKHENSATYGDFATGFTDPISPTSWCRKNYVIIVTDGLPTHEGNTRGANDDVEGEFNYIEGFLGARTDGDYSHGTYNYDYDTTTNPSDNDPDCATYAGLPGSGGTDYLDDVAKYLHDTDLRPEPTIPGTQNITTFVIGFALADPDTLLSQTASNGGGEYKPAASAADLEAALTNIMATIIDRAQTFTAPVVPVQRTTSGDKMYISLFTPRTNENFWPGYLVKLKIGTNGELMGFSDGYGGSTEIQVTDSYGTLHEDLLRSDRSPYPYWDAQYEMVQRNFTTNPRDIYTYLGDADLNDTSNIFNLANVTGLLGTPTKQATADPTPTAEEDLINYIYGMDAYDEDQDTVFDEKRNEIIGDILHSKPLIVDYKASDTSNPQRVIYVGTNDGMLHAFDDTDGSEKWAFIPPDLLPKLKDIVEGTGHQYYVDSSPQAYILDDNDDGDLLDAGDKVYIVFGERRGGTSYCALDVTNPDDPQFLWRIDDTLADYTELGQTWSEPVIGKVKVGAATKNVAIVGGGYSSDNSAGRALYVIDIDNGDRLAYFTSANHANMTYSIPSTVLAVDTTFDGYINRVYVGDLNGQMWRFGYQRVDAGDPTLEDGNINNWAPRRQFSITSTTGRKIFYPPDMVLEPGYAYLYFGTGDRTDPMDIPSPVTGNEERFYAVKDENDHDNPPFTTLTESDLYDATANLIQDGDAAQKAAAAAALAAADGWYIKLNEAGHDGEKILSPPTVIFGMLLFTTFTPVDTVANPCSYGGDARLYAVNYLNAASVIDFDADFDLDKADRSLHIGQGIPTEVVITITNTGDVRGYVGAGGGIILRDFTGNIPRFNIDAWREEF